MVNVHKLANGNQIRDGLEPCPFCGPYDIQLISSRLWNDDPERPERFWLECPDCGAEPFQPTEDKAELIAVWSRRVTSEANQSSLDTMGGRIEALSEFIEEQIKVAKWRIMDGKDMGANVWRIALEDFVEEATKVLRGPVSRSHASHQAPVGLGRSGFDQGQGE